MSLNKLSTDKMSKDKMSTDKVSKEKMSADKMSASNMYTVSDHDRASEFYHPDTEDRTRDELPTLMEDIADTAMDPAQLAIERDVVNAKAYLLTASTLTGLNLYDHVAKLLTNILDERPCNLVDIIEDLSLEIKRKDYRSKVDTVLDKKDKTDEVELAEVQQKLFTDSEEAEAEPDDEEESPLPNLPQLSFYFEQAGIGLNREEMIRIWLSLKTLVAAHSPEKVRFWGKILGMQQNYVIAEVDLKEGEEDEEEEEEEDDDESKSDKDKDEDEEEEELDEPPKPKYKKPPRVPKEEKGTGANKKTYFVCNEPGKPWVRLPSVTPKQIFTARRMKKFFTGRLDAPIVSYPPFPGNESNYLRAQIARISAGTQISPVGFYQFDEEDDFDEEEGAIRDNFIENPEFEPIPVRDLIDPELSNWVHHVLHILPQGRCTWWNPVQKGEEEEENEEEEEEEEPEEPEPEVGPPLLTPLSEDAEVNGMAPWTTQLSSRLVPQFAVAVIHSCLWPGAHAIAFEKTFENIYIGWGHKYSAENYSPPEPSPIEEEFPSVPNIAEMDDPTPEDEARLKASMEENEEEEEEGEFDDEDEDDEDDD